MPPFTNPFNPSSTSLLRRFEKKQELNVTQPTKRRNAVSQIELAAQIAENTEIPAVKAHEKAKERKVREYTT
ncbi:MAG: hypothetical protein Q9209_002429 [Squamulea sp. 1 TL-2023]